MTTKISEDGLHIPKELLAGMDEVEIRREQNFVVVRPVGARPKMTPAELRAGYEQMAADEAREAETIARSRVIPVGVSGQSLIAWQSEYAGWSAEDLVTMAQAVKECRQIDADEW